MATNLTSPVDVGTSPFTPLSTLDVASATTPGVAIGSYAGTLAAPIDGLIVSGPVAIGTISSAPTNPGLVVGGPGMAGSILAETTDITTNSAAVLSTTADTTRLSVISHGSARTVSRYGLTLGGWAEASDLNISPNTSNGFVIGVQAASPLVFGTDNLERVRIDGSGNVGIGTTTPADLLDVNGASIFRGSVDVTALSGGGIVKSTSGVLGIAVAGTDFDAAGAAATAQANAEAASVPKSSIPASAILISNAAGTISAETTIFNVIAFGADPTGATYSDSAFYSGTGTGAFEKAVASHQRFKIRIPAGTYKLKTQLPLALYNQSQGFSIEGDGAGATLLSWDPSLSAGNMGIVITLNTSQGNVPDASPFSIRGFSLNTQTNAVGTGLTISYTNSVVGGVGAAINLIEDIGLSANVNSGGPLWNQAIVLNNPYWTTLSRLVINTVGGVQCNISGTNSLDQLKFDNCAFTNSTGYGIDFEMGSTGFQTVTISDCAFVGGADCIHVGTSGGNSGGPEDWILRDCYLNNRGSGSYAVNFDGTAGFERIWIHDCFFDYASGMDGCLNINQSEEIKIHHNLFIGGGGSETAITVGASAAVAGGKIDSNEFSNFAHDITLGSNASTIYTVQNQFLNGSASNYSRAPVVSDSGYRNLFDIPVPIAELPTNISWVPVGWRGFVNNGIASPGWGATVSTTGSSVQPVFCDGTNWRYG
jgi:hypothetical protein